LGYLQRKFDCATAMIEKISVDCRSGVYLHSVSSNWALLCFVFWEGNHI